MKIQSAFLLAGTSSGSGKTTITLGILAAFKARGLDVQPFKCGPDFIDPTLHQMVTNTVSANLDLRMCGEEFCKARYLQNSNIRDVAVVEGVMGLFDGGDASSAALANALDLPVVLVVDAQSAAESVAAIVKGFETFAENTHVLGVIFNKVGSARHKELIQSGMDGNCSSKIIGFFPRDKQFTIPDRHLGLHMGSENPLDSENINELVQSIEAHLDLDLLLDTTRVTQAAQTSGMVQASKIEPQQVKLAVARDQAFCFYYDDNLKMLENNGVNIVFFSPLEDKTIPEGCAGIYFGGGYPELFAKRLSENKTMLKSVSAFAEAGGIIYGECGGFMYLCNGIIDLKGIPFPMTEVFPFQARMKPRLSRLGYRKAKLLSNCFLGKTGDYLHGHEFHYSELCEIPKMTKTLYELVDMRREGYRYKNVIGGYLHLHFAQSLENIQAFIDCLEQSEIKTGRIE